MENQNEQINVENNLPQFIPLIDHDDYEILNQYPFTVQRRRDHYAISESNRKGYPSVFLNGTAHYKHILIAKQFIPNPNNLPQVDHINRNRSDYHLSNLRWVTSSQNQYNKTSNRGVQYEFIDDIPEESIKVLYYDTRTEHRIFEDEKYYYYHDEETNEDIFYGRIDETTYRILHINENQIGSRRVNMIDINNKSVAVIISRFKNQHTLD